MRPTADFLVKPYGGERYDVKRKFGNVEFIMSTSQEDHLTTNRKAIVTGIPYDYDGDIKIGDSVIVHHNVFRKFYNMEGREVSGFNHIIDDDYIVSYDQIYLRGSDFNNLESIDNFVFVLPDHNADSCFNGTVVYPSKNLISKGITKGDRVVFGSFCHYRFTLNHPEVLFRMYTKDIIGTE